MPRRPSRISTSPGRIGRPVLCQDLAVDRASRRIVPGDGARDAALGLVAGPRCVGQRPGLVVGSSRSAGTASGHSSTSPGSLARSVVVVHARPGLDHAALRLRQREHGVDRREHGRHRAERPVEQLAPGSAVPPAAARPSAVADPAEVGEVGTLEAVDRLLLVADHEQGARRGRARPAPAKNSSVSLSDDPPTARGLVSWASSTSTWSIRASSLNSTHSVLPGCVQQRAACARSGRRSRAPPRCAFSAS